MNKNEAEVIEVVVSRGKESALIWVGVLTEEKVSVSGGTDYIEAGQLPIIKRCLRHSAFFILKSFYIGFSSIVMYCFYHKSINSLHAVAALYPHLAE